MSSNQRPSLRRFSLLAALLLAVSGAIGAVATAADPERGTLSLENRQLLWAGEAPGGTLVYPEPRPECELGATSQCDEYTLDVDIDPAHWEDHAGGAEVLISWENPENDFDLYVYQGTTLIGESATSDTTSERVFIPSASSEGGSYRVLVSPFNTEENPAYGGGVRLESRAAVERGPTGGEVPDERLSDVRCENGMAGPFPCENVDLEAFLPISELGGSRPLPEGVEPTIADLANDSLNDIWGWTDPETKREYALVGKTDGTAFVDITDPKNPVYRGQLVSRQSVTELAPVETIFKTWRDLKVYKDHVFVGSEEPGHGLQVFDLRKLRGEEPAGGWRSDAGYDGFGNSHNIAINEDSGFLYAIGTNTCEGGPHIVDIRDPKNPLEAGCVAEDGYTHDTQCVDYDGPDANFRGREICFSANEDSVTVVDVTDKANPVQLSRVEYEGSAYTHQGWLTKDGSRFLVNDELDEQGSGTPTTTRIFDVTKLNAVSLAGAYEAKVGSIDHNLYVKEDTVYEANYRSGLRVLDAREAKAGRLSELGFFDVYPPDDEAEFNGAWSNYPYFPSGSVIVSGIEQGLFVLRPRDVAGGASGRISAPESAGAAPAAAAGAPATAPGAQRQTTTCTTDDGFRTVGVQRRGRRGLELEFQRRLSAPVTVDVFQQSSGRRIVGERLVARFAGRADDVRWNGRANRRGRRVTDGYYFARYRMRTPQGVDTRRVALRRINGRWSRRADFHRRASCDLLRSFKVERPVFGGRTNRALHLAFQADRDARAQVTVLRGSRVVRRFAARNVRGRRTVRLRLGAARLPRGSYRVRISLTRAGETVTSMLAAQRL
jgi:choice-of-anchor B domain-containing protein